VSAAGGQAAGPAAGPAGRRGYRARAASIRPLRPLARWAVLIAALALWQAATRAAGSSFFPPPSVIAGRMYQLWFSGPATHLFLTRDATGNLLPSLGRVLAGLAVAVAAGGTAGLALGRSRAFADYADPVLQFARALPTVTLVPVFIAIFRLGTQMEVATIAFGTVWPILLNTADGARSLDPVLAETARAFRLPAWQRLTTLIIPATLPKFFAGLRLSVSLSLILMVFAELAGSSSGLGYEMGNAESSFNTIWLWATLVLIAILGNLLNALELAAEHRVLAWHRGARQAGN
jgi:ABC-type nitrate/sulfonate/bicarbonate transport system permease component